MFVAGHNYAIHYSDIAVYPHAQIVETVSQIGRWQVRA